MNEPNDWPPHPIGKCSVPDCDIHIGIRQGRDWRVVAKWREAAKLYDIAAALVRGSPGPSQRAGF